MPNATSWLCVIDCPPAPEGFTTQSLTPSHRVNSCLDYALLHIHHQYIYHLIEMAPKASTPSSAVDDTRVEQEKDRLKRQSKQGMFVHSETSSPAHV